MNELVKSNVSADTVKSLILSEEGVADHRAIVALRSYVRELSEGDRELVMAAEPNPKWVKKHPLIKVERKYPSTGRVERVPLEYIPIDKIETLLDIFFLRKSIQVIDQGQLFNSVFVKVRIRVFDPTINEWIEHDGVGACEVQTAKGASAADLSAINSGAVQKALPAAKSYAIKDACDHLGNIFGRNVGRDGEIDSSMIIKSEKAILRDLTMAARVKEQKDFIESATSTEALDTLKASLEEELKDEFEAKYNLLRQ